MRLLRITLLVLAGTFVAQFAAAQAVSGVTGVARDTTGAVLPGVTVEAASPALIEKVRVAVTDGQGRFNITELRPGTYSVTFTLPGFSTFRREGIELSIGFVATANADMAVGGLEETVTVSGASPVVDVQSVQTRQSMKYEVLEALPSGARDLTQFASLTLGASSTTAGRNDVGGAMAESNTSVALHGGRGDDSKINYDGMNTNGFWSGGGGQMRIWKFNTMGVQETVIDTGGSGAETETGGANVNMIPRDGGNTFSVHSILAYTNESLSSGKVGDALVKRGSGADVNSLKKVWDYGYGVGGPIAQDKLWFYQTARWWGGHSFAANNYWDKSTDWFRYEADMDRQAYSDFWTHDIGGRLTWQANSKHKINTNVNWQRACGCWLGLSLGQRAAPESATSYQYGQGIPGGGMWLSQTGWNFPASNKLLFQAGTSSLIQTVSYSSHEIPGPMDVRITEQLSGYTWGALDPAGTTDYSLNPQHSNNFTHRGSMSYVTGSHSFKTGVQGQAGAFYTAGLGLPNFTDYTFRGGAPHSIRMIAGPRQNIASLRRVSLFAQDRWTLDRVTLNLGIRYDHIWIYNRAQTVRAGRFIGERTYEALHDVPNYSDITPRIGVAWDVFGTGKTAIKGYWGRYLMGQGGGNATNLAPSNAIQLTTSRLWNDANSDYIPDCVLENLQSNGECGAVSNMGFGSPRPVTQWAESARKGWNVREFSYQYSVALQHELRPGFGVTVAYNRNDWNNHQVTINNALTPSDYSSYCITAPTDSRLGDFSGNEVCGLYDANPDKFGQVSAERIRYQDIPGVSGKPGEGFNGVDFSFNARFGEGGVLMGGATVGRTTFNYCYLNDHPNVVQQFMPSNNPRSMPYCKVQSGLWDGVGSQIKVQAVYPLPGDFVISGSYKHLPGLPIAANYNASNAQVAASLGRDLSACRGAANCTARASVGLAPSAFVQGNASAVLHDARINQVDLRMTRIFRLGGLRLQGIAELYNVLNIRPAQGIVTTYGGYWQYPYALLGGRLFKVGLQIDY